MMSNTIDPELLDLIASEQSRMDLPQNRPHYLPRLEDIRAACLEIQASWTEAEHLLRARGIILADRRELRNSVDAAPIHWNPPECKTPPGSRRSIGGMYGGRVSAEASFHGLVRQACIAVGFAITESGVPT